VLSFCHWLAGRQSLHRVDLQQCQSWWRAQVRCHATDLAAKRLARDHRIQANTNST
jgi:hypothetical protein